MIEMLIYITLVAGILITATSFAWSIIDSRTKAHAAQEIQQNGRLIINKIVNETRSALNINAPVIGASGSQLSLESSDGATDPIIFNLTGQDLTIQRGAGSAINLNSDRVLVTGLVFENLSLFNNKSRDVNLTLTLEHLNPDNRQSWEYSETFRATIELRGI